MKISHIITTCLACLSTVPIMAAARTNETIQYTPGSLTPSCTQEEARKNLQLQLDNKVIVPELEPFARLMLNKFKSEHGAAPVNAGELLTYEGLCAANTFLLTNQPHKDPDS